ncbi:MAG: fibronectin type III domain-containing protein [Paludibacteraceae bacterium]|nr:fibronectin type III domain-containing protein [Paludibacteraceae bacterium]
MRKKLLVTLLCCLTAVAMYAGKEESYVLYEGFEQAIPGTWTQECVSATQQAWEIENGATSVYPQGAAAGQSFVALRNHTTQTQHFVSRLISPVFDIKETLQPILIFSHAQMQRTGDVDVLRVYYRTSADARWVQIGEFTNKTKGWQQDTIALTAQSATYQIAFEGEDMMGRGIALDEVIVRPIPTCDNPYNITADGLTSTTATLRWLGSLDTDSFLVAVSTMQQTDPENPTDLVSLQTVTDFECKIAELERNTKYYAYVLAYCGNSESDWSYGTFTTKNIDTIPYVQTFNKDYVQGTIYHADFWTHGTSIRNENGDMEFMPFINANSSESNRKYYSYSGTSCLVFTGERTISSYIPKGQYVYAATPELDVEDISQLQVAFWGTCYNLGGSDYMNGIIVGVMNDPADFSTFTAVDTVYAPTMQTFKYFVVNLSAYKGTGKYVAFASNFTEKENIFFLDDVSISYAPQLPYVTDMEVETYGAASFTLNADLHGASQVQIVVTKDTTDFKTGKVLFDPTEVPSSGWLTDVTISANQLPYTVQLPQGGKFVQVYMRTTDGTNYGEWMKPQKVQVPMKAIELPFTTGFELTDPTGIWYSGDIENYSSTSTSYKFPFSVITRPQEYQSGKSKQWPYVSTSYHQEGGQALYLVKRVDEVSEGVVLNEQKVGDYIALPAMDTITKVVLEFYMRDYSSSVHGMGCVAVGVMTDPFDITTFDTVAILHSESDVFRPQVVTFTDYKGTGVFPALMAVESGKKYKYSTTSGSSGSYTTYLISGAYIDAVTISKQGGCLMPSNIKAEVAPDKVNLSWSANGMTQWKARLYADADATTIVDSLTVDSAGCSFHALNSHTTYYYSIAAVCGETETEEVIYSFTTTCVPAEQIPYKEDFESWSGDSDNEIGEPMCWTMPRYKYFESHSGKYYYNPYVVGIESWAHTGSKCLDFYVSSSCGKLTQPLYAALPLMADTLQELQMTLWAAPAGPAYVGDTLFVGVMTDLDDITTIDTVAALRLTNVDYDEYVISFEHYTGKGQYIAFFIPAAKQTRTVYIDDIVVDYLPACEKIQGVSARNMTSTSAEIHWQTQNATQWDVVVSTAVLELGDALPVGEDVVYSTRATAMPCLLPDTLDANTAYYVYVRAVCSETEKGEWSMPATFKTTCVPLTPEEMGVIDFSKADEMDCWTVGMREGATASNLPKRNTNGYLYMFNTTTTDGAYAIMPPLNVDSITRLQVKFLAHGGSTVTYLRELTVGVITNPADLSTFSAITTISLPRVSSTTSSTHYGFDEAEWFTIRFDTYTGDYNGDYGKQIVFLSESGDKANYIYMKNISVDTIPACPEPVYVKATEVNTYDATIEWEDLGTGKYEIQLTEDGEVVRDTAVLDTTALNIDGLSMLTDYSVQVRHVCGEGDTSAWSLPQSFRTACPAQYPLPYSEDFDDYGSGSGNMVDCWEGFRVGTTSLYPYPYTSAKKDGKNGLYLYRTTSASSVAVLPMFDTPVEQMFITFDYRNASTSNKAYFVLGVATDITSYEGIDSTLVVLDSVEVPAYKAPDNVWHYYSRSMEHYQGGEGHLVLLAPKADVSANNGAIYLDNFHIEKTPTCFRPINLELVTATTESLTFTWTPTGKETAWDVACVLDAEELDTAAVTTVTEAQATISGLNQGTAYQLYVRANCGEGDLSEWSDALDAKTISLVSLADAHWNFDDRTTTVRTPASTTDVYMIENTWISGCVSAQPAVTNMPYHLINTYNASGTRNNHYALSDSCALYFNSSSSAASYAIMPEIDASLDSLQLHFFVRPLYAVGSKVTDTDSTYYTTYSTATDPRAIKVGALTDPYDMSTFQLLQEVQMPVVTDKTIVEDGHWTEVILSLYGLQGKYITLLSDYPKTNRAYVDDVTVEVENQCNAPTMLTVLDLQYSEATVQWTSRRNQFEVCLTTGDSVVEQTIISDTCTWKTTATLTETTFYQFAVRSICADGDTSAWATIAFETPCMPHALEGYYEDFEGNNVTRENNNPLPICWEYGLLKVGGTSVNSYVPKAIANTTAYQYSHNHPAKNTDGMALRLYNSTSYSDSYVILPEFNEAGMDTLSLHFWARAAYFYQPQYSSTTLRNRLYTSNAAYQKSIVIGTISDMEDMSTFVARDTFTYSQSWSSTTGVFATDDPLGNEYWEEVLIPLKNYKGNGRIVIYYPDNGKTSYFFIDDMEVVTADYCTPISNLRVSSVGTTEATVAWNNNGLDSLLLQVATDEEFEKLVVDSIMVNTNNQAHLTMLKQGTNYYVRAQHFCNEEEISDWSTTLTFATNYAIRFAEDFSVVRTYPLNWERGTAVPEDVFSGAKTVTIVAPEITANWARVAGETFIADNEIRAATSAGTAATNNYWLITPVVDLSTVANEEQLMLTFRLGLTSTADGIPNMTGEGDKFIVAVSEDAGATWNAQNTTWWSDSENDNAAYSYAALNMKGELFYLDMSQYAGKKIRIAFINSSTKTASKNYLRLAQVALNYVETASYAASICQWEDYEDANFAIDAYNLNVDSTTVYSRYDVAKKAGQADQYVEMSLAVNTSVTTVLKATICEGEDYHVDGFDITNALSSYVYKQKLQASNTCDSIVELQLTVLPRLYTDVKETICQGNYYEFNGKKYYTTTVQTDTLQSLVTGCDSIVTLYLTVNAILTGETDIHLCPDQSVEFGKFGTITTAGTYVDTLQTAILCDSIATLHVYTHEAAATTVRAAICQGEKYNSDVWSGLGNAGDYPSKQQTVWGCDSIVTLHLLVVGESLQLTDTISVSELPYVLNGEELLPEGTAEGVYTKTIELSCGKATIAITVGEPMGIGTTFVNTLALTPNPAKVGEPVQVITTAMMNNATLDVISSTGTVIYHADNLCKPLIVPGIPAAGVYLVRVEADGNVYQAKLMVQ